MPEPSNALPEGKEQGTALRVLGPLYGGAFSTDGEGAISFVLPGELVGREAGHTVLEASPSRAEPACVHFSACGGCQYQHAEYATQVAMKREILGGLLAAAGVRDLPEIGTESAEPYGYRNRIRLRIGPGVSGALAVGYSRRGSNEFLPVTMCPIAAPVLWRAATTILALADTDAAFHAWLLLTAELELFTTADESKLQLQFLMRTASARQQAARFPEICDRLREALAQPAGVAGQGTASVQLTGATATLDPGLNRHARRAWAGATWGAVGLSYAAAGRSYWLPRGAFFQVNRFLVDRLVELVTGGQTGALAWDLYAGVGLFTRALAERFEQVIAVEGAEPAAAALGTLKAPVTAVHASTLDFLRARVIDRERPSLIVLDPPRAGLGAEAAQLLARVAAAEIVYVSCDPTTLALDLAHLASAYEIVSVTLIDLFPQTFHIETVTRLRRRKS